MWPGFSITDRYKTDSGNQTFNGNGTTNPVPYNFTVPRYNTITISYVNGTPGSSGVPGSQGGAGTPGSAGDPGGTGGSGTPGSSTFFPGTPGSPGGG